jgi:cytochrome c553
MHRIRFLGQLGAFFTLVVTSCANPSVAAEPSAEDAEFFEKQVRPVLVQSCYKCHGEFKQEGGLRLDSLAAAIQGGDGGAVIERGKPDESPLVAAIRYTGDVKMPPKAKLADAEIAALTEWVKRGAPWPADKAGAAKASEFDLAARKAKQWVFRPVQVPTVPPVRNAGWPRCEIDNFILAKLESASLTPVAPAEKRTLLRRVTFDLIGLPPTPAEIDAFLADDSPRAFETVVNRLLDSPHYGERWARHWLDLVRYAETCGHEFDFELPYAFEYRDYVIRALNADVPYDQFVVEHISGDLLPQPRLNPAERFNESIIGTGFWYLGEATHSPVDIRADEATRADNQIDVFGKTFLAQTLGCARCHDHKFDAISTKDYYALSGYLQSSRFNVTCVDPPEERLKIIGQLEKLRRQDQDIGRTLAGEAARSTATRIAELLRASLAVLHPGPDVVPAPGVDAIAIAAKERQLDPVELAKWIAYLQGPARKSAVDPFHLWAALVSFPGELSGEQFATWIREQTAANNALSAQIANAAPRYQIFEDFSKADYADWFTGGEAFGVGPIEALQTLRGAPFSIPLQSLLSGRTAHSGALSNRLEGALRSRTFTIDKNRVLYHAGGKGTKINLIIDSFRLIQNPIYGGLTITLDSPDKLQWHVQDVSKWIGHNAYVELVDPGEGFLAIDRILFSDDGPPPEGNAVSTMVLSDRGLDSPEKILEAYETLVANAIERREVAKPQAPREAVRHAETTLLQFLASSELANTLPLALAVSRPEVKAQLAEIARSKQQLESDVRYSRRVMAMTDGTPEDDRVHLRGSPHKFGDVVPRRFTEAIAGADQPPPDKGSGRLELARRMIDPTSPVLARVLVNRIWKHHFGEGLVTTPDDFGNMGQPPTHPELLDFLTAEFVRNGWSIKRLHRQMLLSQTYQMLSQDADEARTAQIDPQNRLWHRMNLRRLESEAIRDAILAASGRLDHALYGRSIIPHLTAFMIGRGRPGNSGPLDGDGRRSVYLGVRRNFLTPMLLAFDSPIPFSTIGRRSVSNVPAQALTLMNNPFVVQQAEVWANRAVAANSEPHNRIRSMYVTAFGRLPTDAEIQDAASFVEAQSQQYPPDERIRPWADLAHVLFNVKEFIFIE